MEAGILQSWHQLPWDSLGQLAIVVTLGAFGIAIGKRTPAFISWMRVMLSLLSKRSRDNQIKQLELNLALLKKLRNIDGGIPAIIDAIRLCYAGLLLCILSFGELSIPVHRPKQPGDLISVFGILASVAVFGLLTHIFRMCTNSDAREKFIGRIEKEISLLKLKK